MNDPPLFVSFRPRCSVLRSRRCVDENGNRPFASDVSRRSFASDEFDSIPV